MCCCCCCKVRINKLGIFELTLGVYYYITLTKKMSSSVVETTRAELGLVVVYLNKAEARDKICRAIQYGSKFLSDGQPGTAQNVDKSTSLARKVFRLFKFVNDLHALISPLPKGTPLPLALLGKVFLIFALPHQIHSSHPSDFLGSPRTHCSLPSCSLIKLCGLAGLAFTR